MSLSGGGAGRLFEKIIWRCFWLIKIIWPGLSVENFFCFDMLRKKIIYWIDRRAETAVYQA